MALTITNKEVGSSGDGSIKLVTWDELSQADTNPASVLNPEWGDRSVQVVGTFGGGTVAIQGSNDGLNWHTLNDAQGAALTFTVAGLKQIIEVTLYMRPLITGGAGADINVYMLMRRASSMRA